ncbi:hypothetical protein ACFWB7_17565 [Streptomyces solisilvae]|uniref:hypothetical protein n=1 Tax=Streptomyces malaysiensis TaxID=92644 RepID=UPI0036B09A46
MAHGREPGALTVLAAVAVDLADGEGAAGSSPAVAPAVSLTETPGGPPLYRGGLDDFVDRVVPLLQERGVFRTAYTGSTLRDHLGLPHPGERR